MTSAGRVTKLTCLGNNSNSTTKLGKYNLGASTVGKAENVEVIGPDDDSDSDRQRQWDSCGGNVADS